METDVSSHQALAPPLTASRRLVELQVVALVVVLLEEDEEDTEPDNRHEQCEVAAAVTGPVEDAELHQPEGGTPDGEACSRNEKNERDKGPEESVEELGRLIQRLHVCSMWPDSVGALERPFKDPQRACTDYFSKLRKLTKIAHFLTIVNHAIYENYLPQHLRWPIP